MLEGRYAGLISPVLTHLSISNLTLVSRLELEFETGMSAITGETGAGKSILLGALGLALGNRVDNTLITPGTDRAEVSASFNISEHTDFFCSQHDVGTDDYPVSATISHG